MASSGVNGEINDLREEAVLNNLEAIFGAKFKKIQHWGWGAKNSFARIKKSACKFRVIFQRQK